MTVIVGCSDDNDSESPYVKGPLETSTLIYAVATNNLESNFYSDKKEMLIAAKNIDLSRNAVYLYEVTSEYNPRLLQLYKKDSDNYDFKVIREYASTVSSLDPSRITEVIYDYISVDEADMRGLFLWSHGTGTDPYYKNPEEWISSKSVSLPLDGSFGYDKQEGTSNHFELNIDELADAIPSGLFEYLWFDACYMAGVETIYQLRDKCNYYIASPTEVYDAGCPYDEVLPEMTVKNPDYKRAAEKFFRFYSENPLSYMQIATISVTDMKYIEEFANINSLILTDEVLPTYSEMQKYTTGSVGPFFDLGAYVANIASQAGKTEYLSEWSVVLDKLVIYKNATEHGFDWQPIKPERFSGLSTHIYDASSQTRQETYLRTLDWYKDVYLKE